MIKKGAQHKGFPLYKERSDTISLREHHYQEFLKIREYFK